MIKITNYNVYNFENAIRGMRNPKNSWDKNDSYVCDDKHCGSCKQNPETRDCSQPDGFIAGSNDLQLMQTLVKSGSEHRKFMRQIFVSADITAPLYWWKEADQYKVGTTTDSCSTMHKIAAKEFELDDFSHEHLYVDNLSPFCPTLVLGHQIDALNFWRRRYLETKNKSDWWQLIQLLPSSYNQKRTWTGSYENLYSMYHQRNTHKLDEWRDFCGWIETLPYMKELLNGQSEET